MASTVAASDTAVSDVLRPWYICPRAHFPPQHPPHSRFPCFRPRSCFRPLLPPRFPPPFHLRASPLPHPHPLPRAAHKYAVIFSDPLLSALNPACATAARRE